MVDKKLEEHNRRHDDKLTRCRDDVDNDLGRLADMMQRVEAALAVQSASLKILEVKAETVEVSLASLCELGLVWNNYKGWRNTMSALFGRPTWVVWLLIAALVYVVANGHLPTWVGTAQIEKPTK